MLICISIGVGKASKDTKFIMSWRSRVLVIIVILNIIVMATILVVVCSIFEAKSLSAHSEEETTRVNSFITRRSFHAATSGPKVPAEPCSPVSAANAPCAIVPKLTRDLEPSWVIVIAQMQTKRYPGK